MDEPIGVMAGQILTDLVEVTDDLAALDTDGVWAVIVPFDGEPVCARFANYRAGSIADVASPEAWVGLDAGAVWTSSLERDGYIDAVRRIRESIARGELEQVNLTRRCSTPLPADADVAALGAVLAVANPAPFQAMVSIPSAGLRIASASPECFLMRDGDRIRTSPIKGTAATADAFPAKDYSENRLVTGVVAAELAAVCEPGSVQVTADCAKEAHPGLVHLVSTVEGSLEPGVSWAAIFAALAPPGSVTGAPRDAARALIDDLEPDPRGPYCGTIGLIDNVRGRAVCNVAIRTFWFADGGLHFGTGAGITAGSDPVGEWAETELKAQRLLSIAAAPRGRLEA